MKIKKLALLVLIIPVALILFYYANQMGATRGKIDFVENLDEVAVTIDDEDILFSDLIFYVLFQEQKIEEQARVYNPDSPKDYWNAHTNGMFIEREAKDAILEMAIHDHIMYKRASDAVTVLSSDEKKELEDARSKFWESLYEGQLEKLPLEYEVGNRIMKEIAIIESYEARIANKDDEKTFAGLGWDGYDYKQIKKEHKIKINRKKWDRVVVGDISLTHDNVNYINGLTNEEKEQLKEQK